MCLPRERAHSPVAIGLGFVLNPDSSLWMFLGSFFFWVMHKVYSQKEGSFGKKLWVLAREPICAGLIAGAALVGIGDIVVGVFAREDRSERERLAHAFQSSPHNIPNRIRSCHVPKRQMCLRYRPRP